MTGSPGRPRPLRAAVRRHMMARSGLVLPDLAPQTITVKGVPRTFVAVPGPGPGAPLLLVLHGAGGTGIGTAALSGLATRGPAAGCAVAFPDGHLHVWGDRSGPPRTARRERIDDVAFLAALVERLRSGGGDTGPVFAIGMSNGGFLAEHVARHGLLDLAGVVLVASSATVASRRGRPRPTPVRPVRFLAFHGTADPLVAYGGGGIGPLGRLADRGPSRIAAWAGRGVTAPIEDVAADWAAAGGSATGPVVVPVAAASDDFTVDHLSWSGPDGPEAPPAAQVYRIIGGGHTWPGGAQYLPARIVGPVARCLDATGILLAFVESCR
jgi:polyhydroxybutyrate depolymerase